MLNEFETFIDNIADMDDAMFEAVLAKTDNDLTGIINYEDIGRYTKTMLDDIRDMNYSYDEYQQEVELTRQALEQMRASITKRTTGAKYMFLMRMIETMAATIEEAIASTDYYHVHIAVEKIHPDAQIPTYAHPWDAGADVYAIEDCTLMPGQTKIIPTGLKVNIPRGWMLSVRPRSGLSAKTGLRLSNAPGTIDTGYLAEVGIIITNTAINEYTIHKGERVAQFVVERKWNVDFVPVDNVASVADIDRSNSDGAGFGSTGK